MRWYTLENERECSGEGRWWWWEKATTLKNEHVCSFLREEVVLMWGTGHPPCRAQNGCTLLEDGCICKDGSYTYKSLNSYEENCNEFS